MKLAVDELRGLRTPRELLLLLLGQKKVNNSFYSHEIFMKLVTARRAGES